MYYPDRSVSVLSRRIVVSESTARILGVGLFTLLTVLGAFVRIPLPFTPVPITMQTLFVLLSGLYLKKYDGSISQVLYVALGLLGLPIFAGAWAGPGVLLGPTGGYLLGFLIAPFIVRTAYNSLRVENSYFRSLSSMLLGLIAIHALGVLNLSFFMKINIVSALALGSMPFLTGEAIKLVLGATLYSLRKP